MEANQQTQISDESKRHEAAEKYLTFKLGGESYGIAVLKIREIIRMQKITPVPQMPPHVKGVINLRGKVIPVVDLRVKFSLGDDATDERTCTIVVQVESKDNVPTLMGLIVDAVEEVCNIVQSEIEETPDFGSAVDTRYILGLAKVKGDVKTLLDIDLVVSQDEVSLADF